MFKFLVQHALDEDYVFGRGGKKFEEECILILKDHRYPSVDGISRTAITAPGGNQWPVLLAMLAWMVDLSQVRLVSFFSALKSNSHHVCVCVGIGERELGGRHAV